jgi:hypothetical protein
MTELVDRILSAVPIEFRMCNRGALISLIKSIAMRNSQSKAPSPARTTKLFQQSILTGSSVAVDADNWRAEKIDNCRF